MLTQGGEIRKAFILGNGGRCSESVNHELSNDVICRK